MRFVRARRVLCLALVLTVTLLMSPAALAAPAAGDLRPGADFAGAECAAPDNGGYSFAATFEGPDVTALQHHGDRHRHRCERARHQCEQRCRHHHHHHHHNYHRCVRHCMHEHDCRY
jgi:hypothetical protein